MSGSAALNGRTIALAGLDRDQLMAISEALDAAGAEWQAFSRLGDVSRLRSFDALVCSAALAPEAAAAGVPMLITGHAEVDVEHDFVLPPVRAEEVLLRLQRLAAARRAGPVQSAETPVIVAADDDPTTTAIVRAVLTQNGMICHVARDGQEALRIALEVLPNAVILDVNMPHRDGFEVLAALREEPRTAAIPVLMLTSVQQEADVVKGFRLGADDYVVKPFNPMELLSRIKRLVRQPAARA